jgi:TonB family protein
MYFDFEDGHPDIEGVPSALTPREGVLLTVIVHLLAVILILVLPQLPYFKRLAAAQAAEAERLAMQQRQQREQPRFVFMQPRVELTPTKPPDRAPLSDRDRRALSRLQAPHPSNNQPFARGNTPEYVEKSPPPRPPQQARQPGPPQPPTPNPSPQNSATPSEAANAADAFRLPELANHTPAARDTTPAGGRPNTGPLSEAIRNLSRYTEQAAFDNPNGGNNSAFGPFIQFDSKGVEFGPWIRRFIAQVKRNWFVPYAAMSLRGHVVITFNVHKTGALTEVTVIGPSGVESFNLAAFNALVASNPTEPLPAEYPTEKAFFTVTFFYNERPPEGP